MNLGNPYRHAAVEVPYVGDGSFAMEFTTTSPNTTVYLPIRSSDTNGRLSFDDGTSDVIGNPDQATHTFANAGTYIIKYYGTATSLAWGSATTAQKQFLTKILDWGITGATSAKFENCSSLISVAANLESTTTDLSNCFANHNGNPDVSLLDVSNVTNMYGIFLHWSSSLLFVPNVSSWDVSSVIDMSYVFYGLTNFNEDISSWDVSNVTNLSGLFTYAVSFNQDIGNWDVSNVTSTDRMFMGAWNSTISSFNQDIGNWDVSNVTDMSWMFYNSIFNQDINSWDVSNVTNMAAMFRNSNANPDISSWDVSNVTNMAYMFQDNSSELPDMSSWDVSSVTTMSYMFRDATSAIPDISSWDVSSVTNMSVMFTDAALADPDMSSWDFSSVTRYSPWLRGSGISTTNYDGLLNRLNDQRITHSLTGRSLGTIPSTYTTSVSGAARTALLANGWTFTDDGGI